MRHAEAVTAALVLAVGILVAYEGTRLGVLGWGPSGPQPGLYPFLLGAGLTGTAAILLLRVALAARFAAGPDRPFMPARAVRPVLSAGLPAAGMVALVPFLGLYVAAGLYLAAYMHWVGRRRVLVSLLAGVLLPVAGYLIFERWFLIPLPEGALTSRLRF
jgi:hypothetical protein